MKNCTNLLGNTFIDRESMRYDHQIRAFLLSKRHGHCRKHSIFTCFITCRRNHRPFESPPTTTGLPFNAGWSRCSTDAKNASISMWMIFRYAVSPDNCNYLTLKLKWFLDKFTALCFSSRPKGSYKSPSSGQNRAHGNLVIE